MKIVVADILQDNALNKIYIIILISISIRLKICQQLKLKMR